MAIPLLLFISPSRISLSLPPSPLTILNKQTTIAESGGVSSELDLDISIASVDLKSSGNEKSTGDEKSVEDLGKDVALFDEANQEFTDTLNELKGQEALKKFKLEYEKLHRALKISHESEMRLVRKTKAFVADINVDHEKLTRAKQDEQQMTLAKQRLTQEITDAWNSVKESHAKELEKKQLVSDIKVRIESLKAQLATGSGWSAEQEKTMKEFTMIKDNLSRGVETKSIELTALRNEVAELGDILAEEEKNKATAEAEIRELQNQVEVTKLEANKETRKKNKLDKDLRDLKTAVEAETAEVVAKNATIHQGEEELNAMDQQLRNARAQYEKYIKIYDSLLKQSTELTNDLEGQVRKNNFLNEENKLRAIELDKREAEIEAITKERLRIIKLKEHTELKIGECEKEKEKIEARKEEIKERTATMESEIQVKKKDGETLKKQIEDQIREREILKKSSMKAADSIRQTYDIVKILENTKKNLENEINGYVSHASRQQRNIEQLELDRVKYKSEAATAKQKYLQAVEDLKTQEMRIGQMQKKIMEGETRLKQQQNLYEAVRADRNLYSKSLLDSNEEIEEMRRKFKVMNHQIEQLQDEILAKDHSLVKEHFDHHQVETSKDLLKTDLTKIKKQIQSSNQIILNQESESIKLSNIIAEADEERQRQHKEYLAVINEKDILGQQLVKRNAELVALYEKIKIQRSTLVKGEKQYNTILSQVGALQRDIAGKLSILATCREQVGDQDQMQKAIYRLEKDLLTERTKIQALQNEMERPLNIHRWRKLHGSDPARFKLIRRVHKLQKELINKTEEIIDKDLHIQEKEKLYVELKNILASQPGPEVAEQLTVYQQNLKDKQRQMKAMTAELEMYKSQVNEYKYDIERLGDMMKKIKNQYFDKARQLRDSQGNFGANIMPGGVSDGLGGNYDGGEDPFPSQSNNIPTLSEGGYNENQMSV